MKKTALFKRLLAVATAAFCLSAPMFADYNSYGIHDSAEIRKTIIDSWIEAPVSTLRNKRAEVVKNSVGTLFQIRVEEGLDDFRIIVAPQAQSSVDFINGSETTTLLVNVYPEGSQGSWVLYRNKTTGKAVKLLWYFNPDADVYLQFRPQSTKTYVDVVVCQNYLIKSVPLGVPFERLYEASFADVQQWTARSVPWEKITVQQGLYHPSLQMIGVIRSNLDRMVYLEDACYNEKGELYSIMENLPYEQVYRISSDSDFDSDSSILEQLPENALPLSGAGFLKWIVDGIIYAYNPDGTKIETICVPTVEYNPVGRTGVLNQAYNISFSLDWCRNLAVACLSSRNRRAYDLENSGVDVTLNNFAGVTGYIQDTGYSVEMLKSILYVQAVTEPSWFYLGAIKQHSVIKHEEFVFNDCAVFFPYFDDSGKFDCIVFEKGRETTLENFISTYGDAFVHLERVKASDDFYPQ